MDCREIEEKREGEQMRFVDQFHVILLDMANTFMFGVDRFSEDKNFAATYWKAGEKLAVTEIDFTA